MKDNQIFFFSLCFKYALTATSSCYNTMNIIYNLFAVVSDVGNKLYSAKCATDILQFRTGVPLSALKFVVGISNSNRSLNFTITM